MIVIITGDDGIEYTSKTGYLRELRDQPEVYRKGRRVEYKLKDNWKDGKLCGKVFVNLAYDHSGWSDGLSGVE